MTKRFRMIAGPNGSGKSTLVGLLRRDYAVNFYTMLNADESLPKCPRLGPICRPCHFAREHSSLTTACWRCGSSLNTLKRAALHLSPKTRQLGSHLMFWQRTQRFEPRDTHQHHFSETPVFVGCGVRAVRSKWVS